ncbi:MAG: sigma-70 family RNA polymerase sigma factor [Verrucomicrobiaceae bacterium]|nr:sigma-70 family RNA polymerase sigma factor [Verrucomicrobiaceae bacterium]
MEPVHPPPDQDLLLLTQVAGGDHAAFTSYYQRVSGPLYSMALRMLNGNEQEARDALQEGMEEIWRKAPTFDPARSSPFTWSVMIFRSRLVDRVRRLASRGRVMEEVAKEPEPVADEHHALQALTRREDCTLVRRVLAALKSEQQDLLNLAFFSGHTQQEIAERTGRPLGTVKTTIRRALMELKDRLIREGYEA